MISFGKAFWRAAREALRGLAMLALANITQSKKDKK